VVVHEILGEELLAALAWGKRAQGQRRGRCEQGEDEARRTVDFGTGLAGDDSTSANVPSV
jgi:hypothetical protein